MARILIVYSSLFGANAALAALAASALADAGAEVRVRRVREVALAQDVQPQAEADELVSGADLDWADGFVFGSPSHTGLLSASMKAFIDEHHDAAVAGRHLDKTFTAMATSGFAHAGQERVVDDLNAVGAAWGCILVPPSTADATLNALDGNPYGLSFVLSHGALAAGDTAVQVLSRHLARFVRITDAVRPAAPAAGPAHTVPTIAEVLG